MSETNPYGAIVERIAVIEAWLEDEAPFAAFDQRHLEAATPEQAYWHLGYRTALQDVLRHIKRDPRDTPGTSNCSPSAEPGE